METEIGREIGEKAVITLTVGFGLPQQRHDCLCCYSSAYGNVGFVVKREGRTDIINFTSLGV